MVGLTALAAPSATAPVAKGGVAVATGPLSGVPGLALEHGVKGDGRSDIRSAWVYRRMIGKMRKGRTEIDRQTDRHTEAD